MTTKNYKYVTKYGFLLLVSPWMIIYMVHIHIFARRPRTTKPQGLVEEWITKYYQNNSFSRITDYPQLATNGARYKMLNITGMEYYGQRNGRYPSPDQILLHRYFRVPPCSYQQILEWQASENKQYSYDRYYYRTQGIFVELGALDGLLYSNTLAFERFFNWTGLLIEPVPSNYVKLEQNRPQATTVHSAVCNHTGKMEFVGSGATAGATENMSAKHRRKFQSNWDFFHRNQYAVSCEPLASIFQRHGIDHVDFLSVDVEGAEWTVLESISFSQVNIAVIVVELDGTNTTKDENCRQLLRKHAYQFDFRIAANEYWYHPTYLKHSMLQAFTSATTS